MRNFLLILSNIFLFSFKMESFILLLCEWLGSHFYFPLKIKVADTTPHFLDPFVRTSKLESAG